MDSLNYNVRVLTVIEMTRWINDNIKTEIQASDVTKFSGYTHWHFQRLFRQITGYTLSEYIRMSRVLNVATSLANSRNRITHICYDNGFSSQQSLARLFRRYCGCTPSEFRSRVKRDPSYLSQKMKEILLLNGKTSCPHCELFTKEPRKFNRNRPHTPDLSRLSA
ncbi:MULTISPECIES: helix-turn-helix domain-containing protein [Pantoea]|uniref:AraC-type DNA-binding protein n=1 Tax=Candidatus Pantoea floridensis TaxID=1938870 RepID=A0A286BZW7_9GAMM|nr:MULTISPECIES: AraC family transcriptional regulator [Pantoea]PIF22160.1 AraC-like DNA-binding protein [Enterobacteriaceae bacterium JKS000233]PXW18555.1 AraC-like DNA-binding protein [Pantoea sp. JKS000250]SOD39668.1 AraC-type DNA-binding protein [Pantoea floridensis]